VAHACTELAALLEEGSRAPRDLQRAEQLRAKGCELGDAAACRRP
jgi:hypothetical protein